MKYIKHTAIATLAAVTALGIYLNNSELPEQQSPATISKPATSAPELLSQGLSDKALLPKHAVQDDLPSLEKTTLSTQIINQAKTALFTGRHKNGQLMMIKARPDLAVSVADATQAKDILVTAGAEFFSLRDEDDIKITESTIDDLNNVYYSYQQTYKGIPVEGRIIVIQTDVEDEIALISGQFESTINVDLEQLQDANTATEQVLLSLADSSVYEPVIHEKPELRIFTDESINTPVAAFRSVVEYHDTNGINHLEEVFVNAKDASLLKKYSLINTALNRQVYSNRNSYCIGTPGIPDYYVLPGTYKFGESGPGFSADAEEKAVYNNTGASYWFYKHLFSRDSYDGKGVRLRNTVHANFMTPQFSCSGNNAQYRPAPYDQMIFGTGDNGPGLAEALDVVGHELTHGVTHNTSGLKYEKETGAINEAISDIFGAGIEAWSRSGGSKTSNPSTISTNSETWIVCGNCESGLQRYMNNPTRDGRSKDFYPERYTGSDDNGGVHLNSGIMNLAFYLLSEGGSHPRNKSSVSVAGIGFKKALRIYYDANVNFFKTLTNTNNAFSGARNLLAQSAENRYGKCSAEWTSVHRSFLAVGVGGSVPSCSGSPSPSPEPTPSPTPDPVDSNKALTAQAYASSFYRYGYEPLRMNDDKSSTQWRSKQIFSPYQTEYVALDFGKQISFSNITIDWSGSDYPRYFYIQTLQNNYWRTIKTSSKYSSGKTSINVSGSGNMIRVVMKYGAYYRWFAINEITVK